MNVKTALRVIEIIETFARERARPVVDGAGAAAVGAGVELRR